jgi:hypothetical protein
MLIARGVIGGILLFLGRELNFLLAAAMAALLSFRLLPFLPAQWPGWYDYVLILGLAIIAGAIPLRSPRLGYYVSGFIAGGAFLVEYSAPDGVTFLLVPFLVGGVLGSLILGVFTEWALIIISCLIGAYYITDMFALAYIPQMLVGSGLFIIGALTQAFMRRGEQDEHL